MTPRWIRDIERDRGREPLSKWIEVGAFALVSSATAAGWRLRTKDRGGRALAQHRQTLQRRLLGLPERVGMFDVPRWHTMTAETLLARCCSEAMGGLQWLSLRDIPFVDVLQELEQAGGSPLSAATPADVIRFAANLLKQRLETPADAIDGLAVAAIGVTARGLRAMRGCDVCYRFATPGHSLCGEHSSSDQVGGSLGARKLAYQRAKMAMPRFVALMPSVPRTVNRIEIQALAYMFARITWGVSPPDEARSRRAIRSLITASAPLRERLGVQTATLPHGEGLYELLRDRLDPLEMGVGAWVAKLRLADAWLRALDEALPVQRGAGALRQARFYDAVFMARRGATRAEIARELEIDRSTVSQWLKRSDPAGELRNALVSSSLVRGPRKR